jgi:hypothetical protein
MRGYVTVDIFIYSKKTVEETILKKKSYDVGI